MGLDNGAFAEECIFPSMCVLIRRLEERRHVSGAIVSGASPAAGPLTQRNDAPGATSECAAGPVVDDG
jgi:hypothetical protein